MLLFAIILLSPELNTISLSHLIVISLFENILEFAIDKSSIFQRLQLHFKLPFRHQ